MRGRKEIFSFNHFSVHCSYFSHSILLTFLWHPLIGSFYSINTRCISHHVLITIVRSFVRSVGSISMSSKMIGAFNRCRSIWHRKQNDGKVLEYSKQEGKNHIQWQWTLIHSHHVFFLVTFYQLDQLGYLSSSMNHRWSLTISHTLEWKRRRE